MAISPELVLAGIGRRLNEVGSALRRSTTSTIDYEDQIHSAADPVLELLRRYEHNDPTLESSFVLGAKPDSLWGFLEEHEAQEQMAKQSSVAFPSQLVLVEVNNNGVNFQTFGVMQRTKKSRRSGEVLERGVQIRVGGTSLDTVRRQLEKGNLIVAKAAAVTTIGAPKLAMETSDHLRDDCDDEHPDSIPVDTHAVPQFALVGAMAMDLSGDSNGLFEKLLLTTANSLKKPDDDDLNVNQIAMAHAMHMHELAAPLALRQEQALGQTRVHASSRTYIYQFRVGPSLNPNHGSHMFLETPDSRITFRAVKDMRDSLSIQDPVLHAPEMNTQLGVMIGAAAMLRPEQIERIPEVLEHSNEQTTVVEVAKRIVIRND